MINKDYISIGENYTRQLHEYINRVTELDHSPDLPQRRLEHQFECLKDWSLFHNEESIKNWFIQKRKQCPMEVEEIPLNQARGWIVYPDSGNIDNEHDEFFSIHGVRVTHSDDREVGEGGWDQPIMTQKGFDGGILGILSKRFAGIPHYLIEAKAEPGNYEKLQLSPTLQATFSNLKMAHEGRKPLFSEFFEDPDTSDVKVLYRQWLSEDGGRFYLKRNLGMIVEVREDYEIAPPDNFTWMSMYQIKSLLQENAWVNPHIRGIIAHL